MLVEDNELNAEIAETILQDHGAKVTIVKDGLQAVKMFKECIPGSFHIKEVISTIAHFCKKANE